MKQTFDHLENVAFAATVCDKEGIVLYQNAVARQRDGEVIGKNIILSAWSKGIGSCCLGSSARWIKDSPSAKPYLDKMEFSEGYELLYCIALGYPDETPKAKPRTMDKIKFIE